MNKITEKGAFIAYLFNYSCLVQSAGLVNRLLLLIASLLIQLIVSIILGIIRWRKQRKRKKVVAFIWHLVNVMSFALFEVAMWYFVPVLTIAKFIPGIIACIIIFIYSWKGCFSFSKRWKWFWILSAALVAYVILESLLIGDFTVIKGILLMVIYAGFTAASFRVLWKDRITERSDSPDENDVPVEEVPLEEAKEENNE